MVKCEPFKGARTWLRAGGRAKISAPSCGLEKFFANIRGGKIATAFNPQNWEMNLFDRIWHGPCSEM